MCKRSAFLLLVTVLVLAITGCSNKVTVRGKVTFSDDQSPLTAGQVVFQNDTLQARGPLKPDGTFILGTISEKDGIPKGTYQVTITNAMESITDPSRPMVPVLRPLIVPLKDRTIVVDGKQKAYDIVVDRPK